MNRSVARDDSETEKTPSLAETYRLPAARLFGPVPYPPILVSQRPETFSDTGGGARETPRVRVLRDDPGRITVSCDNGPAWLVVRDWWLPGWRARLDNREPVPVFRGDGVIMAVGAAAGDDLDEAVRVAEEAFGQLTLPVAEALERKLARSLRGERILSVDEGCKAVPLDVSTAVGEGAAVVRDIERLGSRTLILRGALTRDFADDLIRLRPRGSRLRLVVRDATVCVLPPAWIARLRKRGIEVVVLDPLRVLAVTTNPFRLPRPLNPRLFFNAVAGELAGRAPVFDVINGLHREANTVAAPTGTAPPWNRRLEGDV